MRSGIRLAKTSGMMIAFKTRKPGKLSKQLREGKGPDLARRRGVVGLSFLAATSMQVVGLFQMGLIRHIPEPPGFDAETVDASKEAYGYLSVGDAFLGLGSYAFTAALAAMGPANRARTYPWIPLALAAKAAADTVQAARLTRDQWTKHRAFCFWCLVAAGATFAALPLTIPEARRALDQLRNGEDD